MARISRFILLFCAGLLLGFAGCTPKPATVSNKVIYPVEPIAPTQLPKPTSLPRHLVLPTPVPVANAFTESVYQQAAGFCARAAEQPAANLSTPSQAVEAPLLSMYASSEKSEWEPASASQSHRLTEASAPDQVRSLVCIQNHMYEVGKYTDGTTATRSDWTVYLLSWPEGVLLEKQVFSGGAPAAVKTGFTSGSGASPSTAFFPWLLERFTSGQLYFNNNSGVARLSFSPDGKYLAAVTTGGTVKVWDLQTRQTVFAPDTEDWKMLDVQAARFSPTGSSLALAGRAGLRLISVPDGAIIAALPGNSHDMIDDIYDIAFIADGSRILAGMLDGYREYASAELALVNQSNLSKPMRITQVQYSQDSSIIIAIAIGTVNTTGVYAWRLADGSEMFFHRAENAVFSHLLGTNDLAIATEKSSSIWLYNLATGQQSGSLQGFRVGTVISLASVDPNEKYLAGLNDENHVIIWDIKSQNALSIRSGGKDSISTLQFSPDGGTLAVGFESGIIELWPTLP